MYRIFTKITILVFFILAVSSNVFASGDGDIAIIEGVYPISISKAKKHYDMGDAYFFDVNSEEDLVKLGFVPGAISINMKGWEELLPADKDATLIFYCLNRLCFGSSESAFRAQELGYKNSFVMLDGIEKWIIQGNPVVKLKKVINEKKPLVKDSGGISGWLKSDKVLDYSDGVHSGMTFGTIPACRDCHGPDGINTRAANDKESVNDNCGTCHKDANKSFIGSVHSIVTNPKENSPSCSDCHTIHSVKDDLHFSAKQLSDKKCGSCHEKEQKHYYETFHGKAMLLDSPGSAPVVAACYDCHGAHNVHKVANESSTLFGQTRIDTCAKCHPGANENFANFIAHADHTDKENFPLLYYAYIFMTALVCFVFGFFGIHTFLWSMKLLYVRYKYADAWKKAKEAAHSDKVLVKRFSLFHKLQHFFMAASFLGLTFSGLPQKFYQADWAQTMIAMMNGPIMATKIHHISAIIMILVFLSHIIEVALHAWNNRDVIRGKESGKLEMKKFLNILFGPDSLMPRAQDIRDMKAHFLWFFGKGERPQFDRWTYWEKFDYLAVFWGMFIIGLSGLILWFPVAFSSFLPGWMLNLSTLIHSDEALLATGFIFAIHFFNTHFRADRFPMDMAIFSGYLTQEEIKQERGKWYERLIKNGSLDKLAVKNDNFASWSWAAKLIGFAMLITGMIFLFLIIYAFIF